MLGWGQDGPLKRGGLSESREKYIWEVAAERMTDCAMSHWVSDDMEHGNEYELEGKMEFEEATGIKLHEIGFVAHPTIEWFGGSADALILGSDGKPISGVEVKCPRTTTLLKWQKAGTVPLKHTPQMLAYMSIFGVSTWYFVAYDPRIKIKSRRLFVRKFTPEPAAIPQVEFAAATFLGEVEAVFEGTTTA